MPSRHPGRHEGLEIALEVLAVDERQSSKIRRRLEVVSHEPQATEILAIVRNMTGGIRHRGSHLACLLALDDGPWLERRPRLPPEMPEEVRAPRDTNGQHAT
jgi:hypothetical protein